MGFPLTQDVRSHVALSPVDFINKIWFSTKWVKGKYFYLQSIFELMARLVVAVADKVFLFKELMHPLFPATCGVRILYVLSCTYVVFQSKRVMRTPRR